MHITSLSGVDDEWSLGYKKAISKMGIGFAHN